MSCSLVASIPLDCSDQVGGIKEIKVRTFPGLTVMANDAVITSGVVTLSGAQGTRTSWYTWGIEKETASFGDKPTKNVQNGTVFYDQEVKVIFNRLSAAIRNEIVVYAQSRVLIAVRDMNDNYWLFGYGSGMDLTSATSSSGTARGDRSGSELTFTGKEAVSFLSMSAASYNQLVTA